MEIKVWWYLKTLYCLHDTDQKFQMRVFPNGMGMLFILGISFCMAWIDPSAVVSFDPLSTDLLSKFVIFGNFFLQGWKLSPPRLYEVWSDGFALCMTQIAILAIPIALVLGSWVFGLIDHEKLSPFLLLACLPTTVSSCVVYTERAGGDSNYALGQASISNFLAPLFVPLAWFFLINPVQNLDLVNGEISSLTVIFVNLMMMVILPCFLGYKSNKFFRWGPGTFVGWILNQLPFLGIAILAYFALCEALLENGRDLCLREAIELSAPLTIGFFILGCISWVLSGWIRSDLSGRLAVFFCLSQKSLAMGIPMVHLLAGNSLQTFVWIFPILLFHFIQLFFGAIMIPLFKIGRTQKFVD